jgi:pimeloyl-ACP methyl ester carboxylesterase
MDADLHVRRGGSGESVLLLLHGLGATGDVWHGWEPLLARRWSGRWVAPDLPGHGGSRSLSGYTFEALAAAVARIVEPDARVVVLGHSLVSGLAGLLPIDHPAVEAGLREEHGRWRLAMDSGAFAVGAPDMPQLLTASQASVILARGEQDPMNTDEQLARLSAPTVTLPGLGHNAHVENPELSIALLDPHRV